jgi:hypothetical protein
MTAQYSPPGPPSKAPLPPRNLPLERRAEAAMSEEFVENTVVPYVRSREEEVEVYAADVVRDIGTGRATIRYDFGEGRVAYGKLFDDDSGYHAFKVLGRLWANGFGEGSTHRVCQPLAYLPKEKFLLTRAVEGEPLSTLVEKDDPDLAIACRDAARWLVKLHSQRVQSAGRQPLWDSLRMSHNVRRLLKASQAVPEAQEALMGMLKAVWTKGGNPQEPVAPTQTHGRYHHDHVFLAPGLVSVIDFDGCIPSDPARDLAEFLSVMRGRRFKRTGEVASMDGPTRAFLHEYLSALPWNGVNLPLYWGVYCLESSLRLVKKAREDEATVEHTMAHLSRELLDILNQKYVPAELRI